MTTLPKLVIIGAGGFGREMWAWAEQSVQFGKEWTLKGFIDDNVDALRNKPSPGRVLGSLKDYEPATEDVFICAIGTPKLKHSCSELITARGGRLTRLFHKSAVLGHEVICEDGVVLCPHVVVSANNHLGRGVAVNIHSSVDHDACIGAWSQINCHCDLTGGVMIGREVWLSSRVSVAPGIKIGDQAYIGAGSVVMRDVEPGTKVFGVPARRIE